MDLELEGKVVILTGGASGIGRATAARFHREGAKLTVLDRNQAALDALAAELDGVVLMSVDVTDAARVAAAHDETIERFGRLDIGVNNAAVTRPAGWLHELAEDDFDAVLAVNLKGVWLCMREQLRAMYRQRSGVVVNMASTAALVGAPGTTAYTASKHAVIGMTQTAALEYASLGIRVNAVCPGTVDTPLSDSFGAGAHDPFPDAIVRQGHPLRPIARPEEIADGILFLASDRSSFATGSALVLDGGFTAQ